MPSVTLVKPFGMAKAISGGAWDMNSHVSVTWWCITVTQFPFSRVGVGPK